MDSPLALVRPAHPPAAGQEHVDDRTAGAGGDGHLGVEAGRLVRRRGLLGLRLGGLRQRLLAWVVEVGVERPRTRRTTEVIVGASPAKPPWEVASERLSSVRAAGENTQSPRRAWISPRRVLPPLGRSKNRAIPSRGASLWPGARFSSARDT